MSLAGERLIGLKFNEIEREQWEELQPYLDTCLLPLTGLTGAEPPADVTLRLEQLRDALDLVEIPFKGRVVTYPAQHYIDEAVAGTMETVCTRLKQAGFKFVIVVTASGAVDADAPSADLFIGPGPDGKLPERELVASSVMAMWQKVVST
jgi:hypothetical protein